MVWLSQWLGVGSYMLASCHGATALPTINGQQPLAGDARLSSHHPTSHKYALKIRQNDTICNAGSAQWTGHVPLGKGRDMFYWYFESRVKPETAPLVIWTNGGPGGSSMVGATFEIGPCVVSESGNTTSRNPLSWTNHVNIVFIDQPIGVGLSPPDDESLWARTTLEGGIDVDKFLDTFLGDLFPDLADRDIHFAGESFGGKYVPVYAAMTRRKFASVILVDPFVDPGNAALGTYDHFCPQDRESRRREEEGESSPPRYLNETACAAMAAAYSQCETLSKTCSATYDADFCFLASDGCNEVTKYFTDEIRPGGRDPYDDRQVCDKPPLCDDMGMDRTNVFFNLKHVKQALGLPQDFKYDSISWRFNEIWNELPEVVVPSTRELTALLDDKHTRILVINGNNDGVITSENIIRSFDELPWHGHAAFRREPYGPFYYGRQGGDRILAGQYKSVGNLTVVTVNEAGHMSVHDQPEATLDLLAAWVSNSSIV